MKMTTKKHKKRSGFLKVLDIVLEVLFSGIFEFLVALF